MEDIMRTHQLSSCVDRFRKVGGHVVASIKAVPEARVFAEPLQAVMAAEAAEWNARAEVDAAKVAFERELRVVYGHLTVLLGDTRKVEAFFPAFTC